MYAPSVYELHHVAVARFDFLGWKEKILPFEVFILRVFQVFSIVMLGLKVVWLLTLYAVCSFLIRWNNPK